MPTNRLTSAYVDIYAQTLLDSTKGDSGNGQQSQALELSDGLREVTHIMNASPELREALRDSSISLDARIAILGELFPQLSAVALAVLRVMLDRNELHLLGRVEERLIELLEAHFKVTLLDVTTSVTLDEALRVAIEKKYAAQLGTDILLREHVDKAIRGGIIMETHGQRIDASITSQLARARTVLASGTIGGAK
jgi:F-type H+-transporting ATPase subunit delta